jgi:DnaJ-class molecular chaperone
MALIRHFKKKPRDKYQTHHEIEAAYYVFGDDETKLIQIDTFGRKTREKPGKQSQTIQLDRIGGKTLFNILKSEFGFS